MSKSLNNKKDSIMKNNKYRVALCISGKLRNYKETYDNLYKNVIEKIKK